MWGGIGENLIRVVREELVQYRIGSGATTFIDKYRRGMAKGLQLGINAQLQIQNDLKHIAGSLSEDDYARFDLLFNSRLRHLTNVLKLYEGRSFSERYIGYKEARGKKFFSRYNFINILLLLPPALGNVILNTLLLIKKTIR